MKTIDKDQRFVDMSYELDDLLLDFAQKHSLNHQQLMGIVVARIIRLVESHVDSYAFFRAIAEEHFVEKESGDKKWVN